MNKCTLKIIIKLSIIICKIFHCCQFEQYICHNKIGMAFKFNLNVKNKYEWAVPVNRDPSGPDD